VLLTLQNTAVRFLRISKTFKNFSSLFHLTPSSSTTDISIKVCHLHLYLSSPKHTPCICLNSFPTFSCIYSLIWSPCGHSFIIIFTSDALKGTPVSSIQNTFPYHSVLDFTKFSCTVSTDRACLISRFQRL